MCGNLHETRRYRTEGNTDGCAVFLSSFVLELLMPGDPSVWTKFLKFHLVRILGQCYKHRTCGLKLEK